MKMKKAAAFILSTLILLILTSGCSNSRQGKEVKVTSSGKDININVEVADTPEKRALGLMYRDHLEPDEGMLFVYDSEQSVSFWMKNTLIPLDLIFVDGNGSIADIKKDFQPCRTEICESYKPKAKARYVLEVNSGFAAENGIKEGDFADFKQAVIQ